MISPGAVIIKIAGRDAGKVGVVIDVLDKNRVLVDGDVRRKAVSLNHIDFTGKRVDIAKGATTDTVRDALNQAGFTLSSSTAQPRKPGPRQIKKRASAPAKQAPVKKAPAKKPAPKKAPAKKKDAKPVEKKAPAKKDAPQ